MSSRILVVGQLPPPVHGSNVMTERFMEALAANGHEACLVEKTFSKNIDEIGKASFQKILRVPGLLQRVDTEIKAHHPDLCVYFITVGLPSLLVDCLVLRLLARRNVPYLLYFHGKGYRAYQETRYLPVRSLIHNSLRGAIGGLVLGEGLKADVNHLIPDDRLLVLPNGIPEPEQLPAIEKKDGPPIVAFLSNLIPSKGPMRFLQVAKLVHAAEPEVRFVLAGRPASEKYLQELNTFIRHEGLSSIIDLPGGLYGVDKNFLFQNLDIFLFPTSFKKEALPLVLVEALQFSKPVISSPIGAIPEIIQDGVNGYIVDPENISLLADRILTLVRNKTLRQQMGQFGRNWFEHNYSLKAYNRNVSSISSFIKIINN